MVRRGEVPFNRLEGVKGNILFSRVFQGKDPGKVDSSPFGQYYCSVLPTSSGFYTLSGSLPSFQGYFRVLPCSQYSFDPCSHRGSFKCPCRPRFQKRAHCNRVVIGSSIFFVNLSAIRFHSRGGPVCHAIQFPIAFIRLSILRCFSSRLGCNVIGLEPIWVSIHVSPSRPPSSYGKEASELPRFRVHHRPLLANSSLVFSSLSKMQAEVSSPSGL